MTTERPNLKATFDAWLRGELDPAHERQLLAAVEREAHLSAEANAYLRLLAELRSLPQEAEPERDLWPEIARRLAAPRRTGSRRVALMLAASLLVAVGLATILHLRDQWAPGASPPAAPAVPALLPTSPVARSAYAETDQAMAAIRDQLRRAIEARQHELPEATRRLVSENLRTIERAIADIEAALAERPANPELARTYVAYRQRQIALLRQVNHAAARL